MDKVEEILEAYKRLLAPDQYKVAENILNMEEESKNLLPTVDVPDFVDEEEDEEYDVDYKPSPMWDLE